MEPFYNAEHEYDLSPEDLFTRIKTRLLMCASVTAENPANWSLSARGMRSGIVTREFAISSAVIPLDNGRSRLTLSASSVDGVTPQLSEAQQLFSTLIADVGKNPISNVGFQSTSTGIQSTPMDLQRISIIVGGAGIVAAIIGQLVKSHYAPYNFLCTGYTPGSGDGCGAYTSYYSIGTWLFILGIIAIVVAVGMFVSIYTKKQSALQNNTSGTSAPHDEIKQVE